MVKPRLSIARMMAFIAAVAFDLGALRAAFAHGDIRLPGGRTTVFDLCVTFGPIVLLAQLGADRVAWGRPERRPFWLGMTASALAVALILTLAKVVDLPYITPACRGYSDGFYAGIRKYPALRRMIAGRRLLHGVALSAYLSAPQLGIATAAGVLAASARRGRGGGTAVGSDGARGRS